MRISSLVIAARVGFSTVNAHYFCHHELSRLVTIVSQQGLQKMKPVRTAEMFLNGGQVQMNKTYHLLTVDDKESLHSWIAGENTPQSHIFGIAVARAMLKFHTEQLKAQIPEEHVPHPVTPVKLHPPVHILAGSLEQLRPVILKGGYWPQPVVQDISRAFRRLSDPKDQTEFRERLFALVQAPSQQEYKSQARMEYEKLTKLLA